MGRYVVTDLTRFSTREKVCVAVVDLDSGICLRPMPYFQNQEFERLNIHPGALLEGEITLREGVENPHIEDAFRGNLQYAGPISSADFRAVLERTLSDSVASGFGVNFEQGQKHIPVGTIAHCSIVTIKVVPFRISIHEDNYKPGKIKASFTDGGDHLYRYMPITDRGFFDYAQMHYADGKLVELQRFVQSQEEVYLRVGLSRQYDNGDRNGYWLQVNGIYTFPDFLEEVRTY